jgi:hypothetical protein
VAPPTPSFLSWEALYRSASPSQQAEWLSLAQRQGVLYAHQFSVPLNGSSLSPNPGRPFLTGLLAGQTEGLPPLRVRPAPPGDAPLDEAQREAVAKALQTPDVCLIQGLPGTGKSRVAAEIVTQAAARGERVLLQAPSAAAIDRVLEALAEEHLVRGRGGLEVYVMCELPSNVILAEEFAARFDGFSIGSNDLTQLVLGVDRDSSALAHLFDETHEAVTRAVRDVIERAHRAGVTVGICGEAPSNHPAFAEMLVESGIDSISVSPDRLLQVKCLVAEVEARRAAPAP